MEFSNEAIFLLIQLSPFTCMEKVDKIQYFIRPAQTDKHSLLRYLYSFILYITFTYTCVNEKNKLLYYCT